ncbi:MAG TPA: substrate-binding domain-containing protein [Micromonosporaceae bacterium]|jgi:hypothetical protein
MGKHVAREGPRRLLSILSAVSLVGVLGVLGGVYYLRAGSPTVVTPRADGTCPRTVRVVTSASFAPVLEALAPSLESAANCVHIEADIGDGRTGPQRAKQIDADVWIPDDAAWAGVAGDLEIAQDDVVGSGTVLAESPVYMVTDTNTAARIKDAGGSWLALANLLSARKDVRLAVRDPNSSADGMVAVGAVAESVWLAKSMDASALALARIFTVTRTIAGVAPALPAKAGEVGLVPEYALLPSLASPAPGRTILAGSDYAVLLRYTWFPTVAAVSDPLRAAGIYRLFDELTKSSASGALATAGLRVPDSDAPPGDAGTPGPSADLPTLPGRQLAVLKPHHVDHVLATWYPADRRTNLLIVVDVSGSMGSPVPGTRTPLIRVVAQGCRSLGDLLPNDSQLGLWEFGANLSAPRDYRVLLPPRPLGPAQRAAAAKACNGLAAKKTGTGLYDTILAAYVTARNTYRAGVPSHVLIFTDGINDDKKSITLPSLSAALARSKDPNRPVQLSVVMFGQAEGEDALKKALRPIDGYVEALSTVDEVTAVFIHTAAGGLHG